MNDEKGILIKNIKNALENIQYGLFPHYVGFIMKAITPVIDDFFEKNCVQAKEHIWKHNL